MNWLMRNSIAIAGSGFYDHIAKITRDKTETFSRYSKPLKH